MPTIWLLGCAVLLILLAGLLAAADAALASFSKARAEELRDEGRVGGRWLVRLLEDSPRILNTALLLRLLAEVTAIVLVTLHLHDYFDGDFWPAVFAAAGVMVVISFVVLGVAPRTLGRQHDDRVALLAAGPLVALTWVLGPIPKVLIAVGNAITPGRGFSEGPFSTETELREMVDIAEAAAVIEAEERRMIHSVFELGDTTVREVMVPRPEVVFIEDFKNLRQARSLFLRSGFSRVPVVGENLDDVRGFAYLKDVARRDFEDADAEVSERIDSVMREAFFVPDSKPVDDLLKEMQARRRHIAVVVDEYGGTAGIVTIEDVLEEIVGEITDEYDEEAADVERLAPDVVRVPARFPIDDLDEVLGVAVDDDEVDSVGGLMAKHLGLVPLPGSSVDAHGLRFVAEGMVGRRKRIATVLVRVLDPEGEDAADVAAGDDYAEAHD
ncbi:hemolysin family protein [Nocardioides limicola]|uniref:hemolysin family protein n=1 Tax=Nocardioides limicola TaxID=2803368 RepID=UPI00193C845F|nr:hemolysin family protein [Nocardioides sp. DJM-14]